MTRRRHPLTLTEAVELLMAALWAVAAELVGKVDRPWATRASLRAVDRAQAHLTAATVAKVGYDRADWPYRDPLSGHYQPGSWGAAVFNPISEGGEAATSSSVQVAMENSLRSKAPRGPNDERRLPHEGGFDPTSVWHHGRLAQCPHPACADWAAGDR